MRNFRPPVNCPKNWSCARVIVYREFLVRWGSADLPVPEVGEAKQRLAALGPP
jgi:hypothetical protein